MYLIYFFFIFNAAQKKKIGLVLIRDIFDIYIYIFYLYIMIHI